MCGMRRPSFNPARRAAARSFVRPALVGGSNHFFHSIPSYWSCHYISPPCVDDDDGAGGRGGDHDDFLVSFVSLRLSPLSY